MRYIITFFLLLCSIVSFNEMALWNSGDGLNETTVKKSAIKRSPIKIGRKWVQSIKSLWIVIVKPQSWKHVFIHSWSTTKELQSIYNSNFVVNGSYFWRQDWSWSFYPAWAMGKSGFTTLSYSHCEDPNLCSYYSIDTLKITASTSSWVKDWNLRSSGPWLLYSWEINNKLKNNISHWQRRTTRTALISPGPYFVFTQTGYTLYEFSSILKRMFPHADAINLDGGSSTSFYSKSLAFNTRKLLPEFFLLR